MKQLYRHFFQNAFNRFSCVSDKREKNKYFAGACVGDTK